MKPWPPITEGTLTPAYGKNYKTDLEAQAAFLSGTDFKWNHPTGGTYCSIRDFHPGDQAKIRYNNNKSVTHVTVPNEKEFA
jgi:hypothetical protein